MNSSRSLRKRRSYGDIELLHSNFHSRGLVPATLDEDSLAQVLDLVLSEYESNPSLGHLPLLCAISAIAEALDNPHAEYRLTVGRRGKTGPRRTVSQRLADYDRAQEIAQFVWNQLSLGMQEKGAVGAASDRFELSPTSIREAVNLHAAIWSERRKDRDAFLRKIGQEPPQTDSSDYDKWLERKAVQRRP